MYTGSENSGIHPQGRGGAGRKRQAQPGAHDARRKRTNLLKTFHPDYRENQFTTLRIGPNKGGKVPLELAALLEGKAQSRARASASGCARTMMRTS